MVKDTYIILPTHSLDKAGIPTITLQGVLMTQPTIQYLSPQRVAVHLLIATQEDYALYQKSIANVSGSSIHLTLVNVDAKLQTPSTQRE